MFPNIGVKDFRQKESLLERSVHGGNLLRLVPFGGACGNSGPNLSLTRNIPPSYGVPPEFKVLTYDPT